MDVSAASFKRSRGLFRRVKWYSRGSGAECIFLQNGDIFFKETSNMRLFSVINGFQKMFVWMGLSYRVQAWQSGF